MLDDIRTAVYKTKQFVKKHQTVSACVLTAVVVGKISHDVAIAGVVEQATEAAYEFGQQAGELQAYLDAAYTFIDAKGLGHEYLNFAVPTT